MPQGGALESEPFVRLPEGFIGVESCVAGEDPGDTSVEPGEQQR
ncbi:hypothetical protein [Streptomyces sp. GbtcB6]|nr:hypothetical protein [Streptomyces sp. GbtcB6]